MGRKRNHISTIRFEYTRHTYGVHPVPGGTVLVTHNKLVEGTTIHENIGDEVS